MDPTLVKGTLFSYKGAQNHLISNGWKEAVNREKTLSTKWKAKYAKQVLEDEQKLLVASLRMDREWHRKRNQRDSSSKRLLYEEGYGRLPYLREQHRKSPQEKSRKPLTSSQEIGWRSATVGHSGIEFEKTEYGHKPVIVSSFFRKSGVF